MILPDHRMTVNITRTFNNPVTHFFFLEPAGIADKLFQFAISILTACHTVYFIAMVPEHHFTATGWAVAVSVIRFGKPYAALETECIISKRSYRANIYHVAGELIIYRIFNISAYFGHFTTPYHTMH